MATPRADRMAHVGVPLALLVLLALVAPRYGFHRDELYLVEAGHHPDWAYPDQPPLVPLLAAAWYDAVAGELWLFRLLPALPAAGVVRVAAATSRAWGGGAAQQRGTAMVVATASSLLVVGHLVGTAVFDAALTSAALLMLIRALQRPSPGRWSAFGVVLALALLVKTLPLLVLGCCGLALLLCGPRDRLRRPWPWLAAGVGLLGGLPVLLWQGAHGWPQLAVAEAIAAGGSASSVDRWLFLPLLVTVTGGTVVVLVAGVVAAWRDRARRWLAVATVLLVLVLLVLGGKPYYLLGLVPALVAVGLPVVLAWESRSARRRGGLAGLVGVNAVLGVVLVLPVLPATVAPLAVVPEHGEQIGWPELVSTVVDQARQHEVDVVLTENYGQAGALSRARRVGVPLPPVHSGHNGYGWWGPPEPSASRVLVVGWRDGGVLRGWFASCRPVATVRNAVGVENQEWGTPVRVCSGPTEPWDDLWPRLRWLG